MGSYAYMSHDTPSEPVEYIKFRNVAPAWAPEKFRIRDNDLRWTHPTYVLSDSLCQYSIRQYSIHQ